MKFKTETLNTCAYTHTQMGTKTISIMDDVYGLLVRNKKNEESFSVELRRILSKEKKDIMKFAGALADMSDEEENRIKKRIKQIKSDADKEMKERSKRL